MAIISDKPYFNADTGLRFRKVVKFSSRHNRFEIPLPPEVAAILGSREVAGKTVEDVERALAEAIERYKAANLKVRKVICYQMKVGAKRESEGPQAHDLIKANLFAPGDSMGLECRAGVYEEREITPVDKRERSQYAYQYQPSSIPVGQVMGTYSTWQKQIHQVDWTEAREKFFAVLITGLSDIGVALAGRFLDMEALMRQVDSDPVMVDHFLHEVIGSLGK